MAHTCNEPGCSNLQWGGGFCKYHQYRRHMAKGDLHVRKKKDKSSIPKESKKRKQEKLTYAQQIKLFWEQSVVDGTDFCFFCGEKMAQRDNIHHLKGRTNDYLNDKEWWVNAHQQCHVEDYHQSSWEQRIKQPWWDNFMARLKSKSEELWRKEMNKGDKYLQNISKPLFDDDDF